MTDIQEGSTQIIFIGGSWDAANDSFLQFKDKDLRKVIGVYGNDESKKNWERLREKIKGTGLEVNEIPADYEDMESLLGTFSQAYAKCIGSRKIVNITGLSKMGSIGAFVHYALMGEEERGSTEFVWLSLKNRQMTLFPQVVFSMAHESSKRGAKGTTSWTILAHLSKQKTRSATLTQLAKECGIKKPSVLSIMDRLEERKLVSRNRQGRESVFVLNEFAYGLMKHYKERQGKKV